MKPESSRFTGERTEKTLSNAARKVLDIFHIENSGQTEAHFIDGYQVSRELYEMLSLESYATAHPMNTSPRLDEYGGITLDELDNKLIYMVAIFRVAEAYDLLMRRTGATEEWFWKVARQKYGDLIFQR